MGHIHIRIVGCALKAIRANKWCIELLGGCDKHEGGTAKLDCCKQSLR